MKAAERRQAIIEVLNERRFEKACNLAFEFSVTERTIYNDITELSFSYPIYTKTGTEGGIYLQEGFFLNRRRLEDDEKAALNRAIGVLGKTDKELLLKIIKKFS